VSIRPLPHYGQILVPADAKGMADKMFQFQSRTPMAAGSSTSALPVTTLSIHAVDSARHRASNHDGPIYPAYIDR
jgi:hypothetical protein